jgi:hypothetical protein
MDETRTVSSQMSSFCISNIDVCVLLPNSEVNLVSSYRIINFLCNQIFATVQNITEAFQQDCCHVQFSGKRQH